MPKVYVETYGCAANKSDTEIMIGILRKNNFKLVSSPLDSDVNIINTCVVKTPTANRMIRRIKYLNKLDKPLIVAGCMAKSETKLVEKLAPKASLIGPNSIGKISSVVNSTLRGDKIIVLDESTEKTSLPHINLNPVISIVQISTGCLLNCSYCETRLARGRLKSFSEDNILKRIRDDVLKGAKEIWLTSQDNGCYGFDLKTNLANLLKKVNSLKCNFFVRVGMMNPIHIKKFLPDLLKAYESEKIFKFFHIPIQSGSDKVLEYMRRGYTSEEFVKVVEEIKSNFPLSTIATDVIVGYPTESEKDFDETMKLIEEIQFDVVNISRFSPRPGTDAFKLKQLPISVIKSRSKKMYELVKSVAKEKNKGWIGWEGQVIIDEKGMGRNFAYKPIVLNRDLPLGSMVKVRVIDARSNFLIGKIIKIV